MAFLRQPNRRTSFPPDTEERVIQRINWGDQSALEALFRDHYDGLCRFVLHLTGSVDDVEDLVQDIFVRIWLRRETWHPKGSIKKYLFKSARNQALNLLRSRRARIAVELRIDDPILQDPSADPAEEMFERDRASTILDAIESLPRKCKLVFTLNRQEGLSYSEIAEVLDISVRTVENQIAHALKILRKALHDSA